MSSQITGNGKRKGAKGASVLNHGGGWGRPRTENALQEGLGLDFGGVQSAREEGTLNIELHVWS
jgi:hypothetical protein